MTEQVIQGSLWETEKDELEDEEKTEESEAEEAAEYSEEEVYSLIFVARKN